MQVRAYQPQDIGRMVKIWNEVVEDGIAFPQLDLLDDSTGADFFAQQTHCAVAVLADGTVVGMYILHPNNIGRCGHLGNASYAVDSRYRGGHIGEALVSDCLQKAAEAGFHVLQFNAVVKTNAAARHLYEKLGFVQLGVIPGGFLMKDGHYEDIVLYYHRLTNIRRATLQDMPALLALYANARVFMASKGNPNQWHSGYPWPDLLQQDIAKEQLYVCECAGKVEGAFVLAFGDDPTYQKIVNGDWLNHRPYGTLHRIASSGHVRGLTDDIVRWSFAQIRNLRADTHELNLPMQKALERNGFVACGQIWAEDGTPRIAYHKVEKEERICYPS